MLKKITFADGSTNEFYNCTCGTKRTVKIDSMGYSKFFFEEHQGIEHILLEYDQSDNVKAEYTLGPGIDEIISMTTSEGIVYYHYDSLGSVKFLTDEDGELIGKYEYDPFGQILSQPDDDEEIDEEMENRFTFTGREYDQDSGLYFYRARYYDASVGRFMTRDPQLKTISTSPPPGCGVGRGGVADIYNPSDLHPYVYVRNNPVNLVDPTGLHSVWACKRLCDIATGVWLNACRLGYRTCASACPGICAPTGPLIGPCIIACELACAAGVVVCNTAVYKWNEQCKRDCEKHCH